MRKIHLDTDLGGDIDDLCALAMLLRWPDVEITGITTVGDDGGKRAGYVRYALSLEGRGDIPVAAGADISGGYYRYHLGLPEEHRYWPEHIASWSTPVAEAIDLLRASIRRGAAIIGIGPYTNLSLLEESQPGILGEAEITLMGGLIYPTRPGFPEWGNRDDFNIQVDVKSAKHVLDNSTPTLVPLSVTGETYIRRAYLDRLREAGGLGQLIPRQAEEFARDEKTETRYGATCENLPGDTINFQHDPLACAIALGWRDGVEITDLPIITEVKDGWLTERVDNRGKHFRVVTGIDGARFSQFWLDRVTNG